MSDRVKRALDRRRREGESYNDALERLLSETTGADFHDGFGVLSDDAAEDIRTHRQETKEDRKRRMDRLEDA